MEKEGGWKDVKKKQKNNLNNSNEDKLNSSSNDDSRVSNYVKNYSLNTSNDSLKKSNNQKYESPSLKNKAVTFGNNNTNSVEGSHKTHHNNTNGYYRGGNTHNNGSSRGARGGRGGRGGLNRRQDFINNIPDFASEEEKIKFTDLREKCPHIMMPGIARRTAAIIRIDNFAEMFTSDEWIELQISGWKYERVVKPDDGEFEIPDDGYEYDLVEMKNKWGDYVLFKKVY